ncbi:MAG: hypothetical protein JNK58_01065 [Phycisphaerae bacterium]|nr:hypothetical protein [Phycisphaerae bacterium]
MKISLPIALRPRAVATLISTLAMSAIVGCQHLPATASHWAEPPVIRGNRGQPVLSDSPAISMLSPTELAYERGPGGTFPYQRFEYSRRDYLLSTQATGPILATAEWPTPRPARERRVRFYYWRQ